MRRLLTDRFCSTAKPGTAPQTDYFDEGCVGLALRISTARKSWTFHYSLAGTRKRLTLGTYPMLSLAAARTRADEVRVAVASGHDPRLIAADTLRAVCDEYMRRDGARLRSADWRQGVLDRHIYPSLGKRPIAEIRRSEIVRLLDRIESDSGPVMADKTLGILRKVMNWYATRSDDFRSPIVRGMSRTRTGSRNRILTDDELRKVWHSAEDLGAYGSFVRFLLLTAARRSEAAGMTWGELNGSEWTLPASRNKTGVDLVRPLSGAARQLLGGNGPRPFEVYDFTGLKRKLDAASGTSGWTLHDLRRTSRSLMSRAGVPNDHAERCPGHVIGGVRGVYDRHEYLDEKRQAYEKLATLIAGIVGP
jgi:integrase